MRLDGMAPGLAFLAGAAISAGAFFFIRDHAETEAKLRFEREASDAKHVVEARVASYLGVLHGLGALLAASDTASRKDFDRYASALDLPRRYPGFSYVSTIHESEPGFGLHLLPSGPALALRLPVYRADAPRGAERGRARYVGSVDAGFRLQELMQGVMEDSTLRSMRFKLYDAGAAQGYDAGANAFAAQRLLFDSGSLLPPGEAAGAQERASLRTMLPMEVGGRIWEVQFSAPRDILIKGVDRALPWYVLAGGLLGSLALSAMLYSLAASRARAVRALGELRFVATHDALTGLANRVLFHDLLTHALRRAARHRSGVAVLFLDLDRFKVVNDTLGHAAGDQLLRECARRLKDSLRESDVVARLGGDEFVVLMEDYSSSGDAVTVADKILRRMAAPVLLEGKEFTPSASIGISVYPDDGTNIETLLKHADIAMYRAKARGRNNRQFYSAPSERGASEQRLLEPDLRAALERGELVLEYQPKFDLRTGSVAGVEALLRWQHPQAGLLLPASFMPLAEQAGLVEALGDWTLRRACEQSRAWRQAGLGAPRIAIGISPRQFARKGFLADAGKILEAAGAPAQSLEFEVTESMLMHHPERTAELLRGLSGMGIALTVDDFGSGYSSLAFLQSLPISGLKIDGAFVKSIPGDPNGMAIAEGVIALGQSLKLTVVAQDLETPEQQEFLIANGCDQAQGSLLCKPLSAQDMTAFLRRGGEDAGEAPSRDPAASSL